MPLTSRTRFLPSVRRRNDGGLGHLARAITRVVHALHSRRASRRASMKNVRRSKSYVFAFAPILFAACMSDQSSREESAVVAKPAFPGAQGFGASSAGGRNGTVIVVDSLS